MNIRPGPANYHKVGEEPVAERWNVGTVQS